MSESSKGKDRKMRRHFAFALFLAFWSLMAVSGIFDVTSRHVPDYPSAVTGFPYVGQAGLYVVFPSIFVLLNVVLLLASRRLPKLLIVFILVIQVAFSLVFLALSGGGI